MKAYSITQSKTATAWITVAARIRVIVVSVAALALLCLFPGFSQAQGPVRGDPPAESGGTGQSEKTYAPIGDSGYKVRIPEFRLKRIIGDQPKRKPAAASGEEKPAPSETRPAETKRAEPQPSGPSPRLPFAPRPAVPSAPGPAPSSPDEQRPAETAPAEEPEPDRTSPAPVVEDSHPRGESSKEQIQRRGPQKESPIKESLSRPETPAKEPEPATAPEKERSRPVFAPPKAPEDIVKPAPPPKKEMLAPEKEKIPPLLGVQASKSKPSRDRVEPVEVDDMADPRGWLPLATRGEPQSATPSEPEPSREASAEPKQQARLEPSPLPEPARPEPKPTPEPSGERPSDGKLEPVPMPTPEPEAGHEATPAPEPTPEVTPDLDKAAPTEPAPTAPPRELVASPLDDDAVTSAEVRDYLRATAPILEELSMLMTRGPSLAVSDYDPSDPNAPVIPKQIHMQMDWIKRELQVLDSKTFAIIPPKKYLAFHELIRQSIAQTYQACDAVIAYLAENKPEDLKKVNEHLIKARDLIHRTTEKTGTS